MKIINETANFALWHAGMTPIVGFVSGPVRALGGVVQTVINLAVAIFLAIPSLWIKPQSKWHGSHFAKDCTFGAMHVARGFIEFIPFTSLILMRENKAKFYGCDVTTSAPDKDHPFKVLNVCSQL